MHTETRQNGIRELDIFRKGQRRIVATLGRVSRGNDSTACLERRDNARFGDGNGLLLHCLVDGCPVRVIHFVKLVDQADTLVREHQGTAFQCPLARDRILADRRSETDSRGSLKFVF